MVVVGLNTEGVCLDSLPVYSRLDFEYLEALAAIDGIILNNVD